MLNIPLINKASSDIPRYSLPPFKYKFPPLFHMVVNNFFKKSINSAMQGTELLPQQCIKNIPFLGSYKRVAAIDFYGQSIDL